MRASIKEAAKVLGVSEYFLRQEAKAGRIPAYRSGRKYLFDIEQVEQFLKDKFMENVKPEEKPSSCKSEKVRKINP